MPGPELVSVQGQGGLEPQGVPGPEAGGLDAGGHQRVHSASAASAGTASSTPSSPV